MYQQRGINNGYQQNRNDTLHTVCVQYPLPILDYETPIDETLNPIEQPRRVEVVSHFRTFLVHVLRQSNDDSIFLRKEVVECVEGGLRLGDVLEGVLERLRDVLEGY